MKTNLTKSFLILCMVLTLILAACGALAPVPTATALRSATATNTELPTFTPTVTLTPTKTPIPTATHNLAATQQYEDFLALVQKYFDAGVLPSIAGKYQKVDDHTIQTTEAGTYRWEELDDSITNFMVRADIVLDTSEADGGCGFVFGSASNNYHEFVFLERNHTVKFGAIGRIYTTKSYEQYKYPEGFTMVLAVYKNTLHLFIDEQEIVVYKYLDLDRGWMGLSVLSGGKTTAESSCDFTNIELWEIADN